jgi:hypothetical protein
LSKGLLSSGAGAGGMVRPMLLMMMAVVMMARAGRRLAYAPRNQNSCGDHSDRHARPN